MTARDPIDDRILTELTVNARISLVTLGARVNLSRNAVKLRIERLERSGTIQGYTLVRGSASRADRVSAVLMIDRADRMRGAEVIAALAKIPEVVRCDILAGEHDILARVDARSVERVQEIWEQVSAMPGVVNTVTSFSLSTMIDREGPAHGAE